MAKAKDNSSAIKIYVLSYFGSDHGAIKGNVAGTFAKKADALKAKRDCIKAYLEDHKALVDGEFQPGALSEINDKSAKGKTLDDALAADYISVDGWGDYWRVWEVTVSVLH